MDQREECAIEQEAMPEVTDFTGIGTEFHLANYLSRNVVSTSGQNITGTAMAVETETEVAHQGEGLQRQESVDLIKGKAHSEGGSARASLLLLLSIFLAAASVMFLVYTHFPQLSDEEKATIKLPRDMDDAKALGKVLSKYKDTHYVEVMVAYFTTYVFLQTFAIPGSIFLSILSGFLYPFPLALFLVCLCSGLGASFCYLLSYLVGRPIVYKYLTQRAVKWSQQVDRHRDHLINYIIFLRITPFLPNWFINITAPVINVPLKVFFWGTFIGVAPPSFIAIKAGTTLYQLTTAGEAVSWNSVIVLVIVAIISILPVIFQNKLKQKFE